MKMREVDIVIFGAGIAGLWTFNRLSRAGYNVLLLEADTIGGGQTIASQGIIHSGLKYAFAGHVNKLAKSISAMPDLWRYALDGKGNVDLSAAKISANSQYMMIPSGMMGGLVKLVATKALGQSVRDIPRGEWPQEIQDTGFKGSLVLMGEPVLDIPSTLRALAAPYQDNIRKIDTPLEPLAFLKAHNIEAKQIVYTGAASNHAIAKQQAHDTGLAVQKRPLLMGMMKNAPYPLYAHLVGSSDKPVATITTHTASDGALVWYIGGNAAERKKDANPQDVYHAIKKGFKKYLPKIDLSCIEWATLPIDRVEGKSNTDGWMPDTPTIHSAGNALYCWPTKLTFAPMLSDMIIKKLEEAGLAPSNTSCNWSDLPKAPYTQTPWDEAKWTKDNSDKAA